MAHKGLQSFAAGMIVTVGVCGIAYYVTGSNQSAGAEASSDVDDLTEEELIVELQESGFVVQTEAEWQTQLEDLELAVTERVSADFAAQLEEAQAESEADEDEDADGSDDDDQVVYRTVLTVSPGMTSIDVGRALEGANIIDRARDFFEEVEDRGLENDLRPGSFEVESGMSMDQLMDIIF
ncbi:hypothetical protein [Alkalihalobacillus pseudalcaliphilus]|uniref:hypothetical protein n=1 Tax=Alkalihalobacillus pseudalcaliphilus TaxID=79884 RepID=UPI00064DDA47|nr:hypothetical protein [Alkalihalobacillus pseudalcaliphilus]KMK75073.1 hypothetical protein AB990_16560 [Alkalihalobacillus pseudalcaliphilus]